MGLRFLYSLPEVFNFYFDFNIGHGNGKPRARAVRMALDIRKALLQDPEDGYFCLRRKPLELSRNLNIDLNAGSLGESGRVPSCGGRQPQLIQQGRMKQVGKRADFRRDLFVQYESFGKS